MTIVLPILNPSEAALAVKSLQWAVTLCGRFKHELLIVVPSDEGIDVDTASDLGALFQDFQILPTDQVGLDKIWEDVYYHFKRMAKPPPFFWYEPDFTLLRPDVDLVLHAIKPHVKLGAITSRADFLNRDIFHATESKTFPTLNSVRAEVDFRIAFHRGCEDGSLVDRLSEERNSTAVNVPNHFENVDFYEPKIETPPGTVDILIVTYKKDFPWLHYCLKSIDKFATGFRKTIVAIPKEDFVQFAMEFIHPTKEPNIQIFTYDDVPGKGFVMHAAKICQAELITDAAYILHTDADTILKEPVDAGQYFKNGKPISIWLPYDSLKGPKLSGAVSDCYKWKPVSEETLKEPVTAYTMCQLPIIYPRQIYKPFRDHVERVQGVAFEQYVLAQKNEYPQSFAEFPSLGGFCFNGHGLRELFSWIDCTTEPTPKRFFRQYWSRGGLDQIADYIGVGTARQQIDEILK